MYVLVLLYIRVEASIRNDREIKHLVSKNGQIEWRYKIFDDGHICIDQILANCLTIIRKRKYRLDAKQLSNIGGRTFSNDGHGSSKTVKKVSSLGKNEVLKILWDRRSHHYAFHPLLSCKIQVANIFRMSIHALTDASV